MRERQTATGNGQPALAQLGGCEAAKRAPTNRQPRNAKSFHVQPHVHSTLPTTLPRQDKAGLRHVSAPRFSGLPFKLKPTWSALCREQALKKSGKVLPGCLHATRKIPARRSRFQRFQPNSNSTVTAAPGFPVYLATPSFPIHDITRLLMLLDLRSPTLRLEPNIHAHVIQGNKAAPHPNNLDSHPGPLRSCLSGSPTVLAFHCKLPASLNRRPVAAWQALSTNNRDLLRCMSILTFSVKISCTTPRNQSIAVRDLRWSTRP